MAPRHRRRSAKKSPWLAVLAVVSALTVIAVLLAPTLLIHWVRRYVQEDAFRIKMEDLLGTKVQGTVSLSPLRWSGDEVSAAEAELKMANGWRAGINGMHLGIDWSAFRAGTWRVVGAGADSVNLRWDATSVAPSIAPTEAEEVETLRQASASGEDAPAWLRRWLPTRTEVDGVKVDRFSVYYPGGWMLEDARLRVAPWQQDPSVQATMDGGYIEVPVQLPGQLEPLKLNLAKAAMRLSKEQVQLTEATLHWLESSEVILRGHVRPIDQSWKLTADFTDLPVQECIEMEWHSCLSGKLDGNVTAESGHENAPLVSGELRMREGVLTALPILERLAAYTGVERFKRLVLDVASTRVHHKGEETRLENIVLQLNGLLRIEGNLQIRQGLLNGDFLVGVTSETLRWIPGAQQHVFTTVHPAGPPGMLWTTLKISGSFDAPREDLTDRLLSGAGRAIISAPGDVVSKGTETLLTPLVGKDAAAQPGAVIKGANETLNQGVETGVKMLEGIGQGLLGK